MEQKKVYCPDCGTILPPASLTHQDGVSTGYETTCIKCGKKVAIEQMVEPIDEIYIEI